MKRVPWGMAVAALGLAISTADASKLSDMSLGKHVYGPKLTKEDLAGRVVVYEFWGYR